MSQRGYMIVIKGLVLGERRIAYERILCQTEPSILTRIDTRLVKSFSIFSKNFHYY